MRRRPGVVLIFSAGEPAWGVYPGDTVELGRMMDGVELPDRAVSRHHARVTFQGTRGWLVEDLGSRNGTRVDGELIDKQARRPARFVRTSSTLFLLVDDVTPYAQGPVEKSGGRVAGALLREAWDQIRRAADQPNLHVTGETGAGKELAARVYHQHGPRPSGPFVAVNCAAIPEAVAERLLFGAKKGAFSDAVANADGYLVSASGGTLFLDEIGELGAAVQAKLLRALETREVLPLGATRPVSVDLHLVSATHHDLRELVAEKRFRQDLYHRMARPHVVIPPLRERLDEIPHLVAQAVRARSPRLEVDVTLVEACLARPWPGNVRELLADVSDAALRVSEGGPVLALHLAPEAGLPLPEDAAEETRPGPGPARRPDDAVIVEALRRHNGRVLPAARSLGLSRNQLRRWLASHPDEARDLIPNQD